VAIRIVQLGAQRQPNEGTRIGTVRRPPRGVRKADYSRRNFFDLWLPELAPSAALLGSARARPLSDTRWRAFARRYRREMAQPGPRRLIALLSALSQHSNFSVGCFCPDESRCHRSILRELLAESGATLA
jgi:uncharacterized protein YeaO (DUF488 family)